MVLPDKLMTSPNTLNNRKQVTLHWSIYHAVSLHFIPWPTEYREWHCICFSWPSSLIAFHPMTNSMRVTMHLFFLTIQSHCISSPDQQLVSDTAFVFLDHPVSLHLIPWPTVCEWHCIWFFFLTIQSHCISSHDQQGVSDTVFVFLDHPVSLWHFIPWPTVCEWHCICFSLLSSLIVAFHPMTNREWVTLHLFFLITQSHCISSHNQKVVSHTTFYVLPCFTIAFHPMANRVWVYTAFYSSSCSLIAFYSWPTASEWLCISILFFYHLVSLHLILWLSDCEWHYSSLHIEV